MIKSLLCVLLFCLGLSAQTPDLPSTFFTFGGVYDTSVVSPVTSGYATFAVQVGGQSSRTYSFTTLKATSVNPSFRTGVAYALFQMNGLTILPLTDGGVASVNSATLGSISSGMIATYSLDNITKHKLSKLYLVGGIRIVTITSVATKPVYEFGIGFKP